MNYFKTVLGLFSGLGLKTYVTLAVTALVSSTVWYLYYDIVVSPLEIAQEETAECRKTLIEVNEAVTDMTIAYDANISSLSAMLKKCNIDIDIIATESFDKGYTRGVLDAEVNQTHQDDVDAICFKPYF